MTTAADTLYLTHSAGTGAKTFSILLFWGELAEMLSDMRWAILLLLLLIIADFRYGWGESNKRYHEALESHDPLHADMYRWHTSRAIRRTANKFADYVVMMLLVGVLGKAVLEPVGIDSDYGSWLGAIIAFLCEGLSVAGHFLYLRGIEIKQRSLWGYMKAVLIALLKRKSPDLGEAVEEADRKEETNGNQV